MNSKFKQGDKVKIIGYGSKAWFPNEAQKPGFQYPIIGATAEYEVRDMNPQLVGQEGVVEGSYHDLYGQISDTEEEKLKHMKEYSLNGIAGKSAWWDEQQLELIK